MAQGPAQSTPAHRVRPDHLLRPHAQTDAHRRRRAALHRWKQNDAAEFRELYAFDPKTETVNRLADCPTAFYATHLAYDCKRELFFAVVVFDQAEQPSGMFRYDPRQDVWQEIEPANPIPPHHNWFGWMQLCYDSHDDCLIGKVNDRFYAFRYVPAK